MKVITVEVDEYTVYLYCDEQSPLYESWYDLGKPYRARKDPPHNSNNGQYHLHLYNGNNEFLAINKDGTAHDDWHGVRIPNKVYNQLTNQFSGWQFPKDQIIESINCNDSTEGFKKFYLTEAARAIVICEIACLWNDESTP